MNRKFIFYQIKQFTTVNVVKTDALKSTRRPSRVRGAVSEAYVGKVSIPMDGGKYYIEFMLRESDLTEKLKKLRQEKMREILGQSPKPKPAKSK